MLRKLLATFFIVALFPSLVSAQGFFQESGKIALGFYQGVISPVRQPAGKCQFTPSCSEYSKLAIAEHGLIKGVILTADRFMRCSGGHAAQKYYPHVNGLLDDAPSRYPLLAGNKSIDVPIRKIGSKRSAITKPSTPPALVFPKRLFNEQEFDYSILELKRLEQDPAAPQEVRSYLPALVAVNYLSKNEIKKSWESLQKIGEETVFSSERAADLAMIRYVAADQMGYHTWNANTSRGLKRQDANALSLYSLARDEDYDAALNLLKTTDIGLRRIDIESTIDQLRSSGGKSPLLAGAMSAIIPGSGYMYAGHVEEGIGALITNGLLGWGIYSLFTNHNTGSGILLSGVALPFYLGSIIGSANTAMRVNQQEQAELYEGLRNSLQIDFYFSTDFLNEVW